MIASRTVRATALFAAAVLFGACSSGESSSPSGTSGTPAPSSGTTGTTAGPGSPGFNQPTDPFYVAPDPLPEVKPGDVIRSEPLPGAPAGASGFKVLYRSTGLDGEPIAVSGVVVVPAGPAPTGGRPVVSWAHGTTGVADACAPSAMPSFYAGVPGLEQLLQAGYVVAATDYQGLGTAGVHPYLVGISEGRGVLDAARAARNLPDSGAGTKLLIDGHSQGGQASLFAGELQPTYAPELQLLGVAAMAPAAELAPLLQAEEGNVIGVVLGMYALNAYHEVYGPTTPGLDVDTVLTPAAATALPQMVPLCVTAAQEPLLLQIAGPLAGNFVAQDPTTTPPWPALLAQNTPGQVKTPAPMFIAQGSADTIVLPPTTQTLVNRLCSLGDAVTYRTYDGASHFTVPDQSIGDITAWMATLVAGQPASSTCSAGPTATSYTTPAPAS